MPISMDVYTGGITVGSAGFYQLRSLNTCKSGLVFIIALFLGPVSTLNYSFL
jgi:hypothetical protein